MNPIANWQQLEHLIRKPISTDDKYSRGVVGFVTGSDAYPGAALLGVQAALKTSIGMVKYVGPERVQDLILVTTPEVVCSSSTTAAGKANVWVLGSGVDLTDETQSRNLELVFYRSGAIAVIDAGALELLDFELLRAHNLLLTPHAGEMARLLNKLQKTKIHTAESIAAKPEVIARQVAVQLGQSVLLKGNTTVISSPFGEVRTVGPNSTFLATAGSGDVLAGLLGAIAAANTSDEFNWSEIAELAVRIHSAAAQETSTLEPVTASTLLQGLTRIWQGLLS